MSEKKSETKLVNRRSFIGASGAAIAAWNVARSVLNGKESRLFAAGGTADPAGTHSFGY